MVKTTCCFCVFLALLACKPSNEKLRVGRGLDTLMVDGNIIKPIRPDVPQQHSNAVSSPSKNILTTTNQTYHELIGFARSLIGIPYKYASTNPPDGFDCSGFITYVFNRFKIKVPRSSIDFTHIGKDINIKNAREGDLILFTGTADSAKTVGHMGIVIENNDTLKFIHSSSGRANGVTISKLDDYYARRFVKVVRILPSQEN